MKKKVEIKYHRILVETIEQFKKPSLGKLISKNKMFNGREAEFNPRKNEFTITFECNFSTNEIKNPFVGEFYDAIQIQIGDAIYILESVFFESYAHPKITGSVDRIHTIGFLENKKFYYRLIIPLKTELKFHNQIEVTPFSTDFGYHSRIGTTASIKDELIKVCCIKNEKKEYFLAIDSVVKQPFEEFADKAYAVKIGLGYLSGFFAGDQGYFFAYTNKAMKQPKHFRCARLRDSIKSSYSPIDSNAFSYLSQVKPLAEKYHQDLRQVSLEEFSRLCEKIHSSSDFSSMIMLMLESSVASLLFMPGGFAIALEALSALVIGNRKQNLAPIKEKSLTKKILNEIRQVLENNSSAILPEDLVVLNIRVDNLNQPTNKEKLKSPFKLLEIDLNEQDLAILETRNDFLHGRVPDLTKAGEKRSTERINKDLYYCSMRLYTLLNMLILKWIGYNSKVVNYPKINEGYTQIPLNEDHFRQV